MRPGVSSRSRAPRATARSCASPSRWRRLSASPGDWPRAAPPDRRQDGTWKGTVVTTDFDSGRNAPASRPATWLCSGRCHQRRTTSSGTITVAGTPTGGAGERLTKLSGMAEIVLRLDRETASDLRDLIYGTGEHLAAGAPLPTFDT